MRGRWKSEMHNRFLSCVAGRLTTSLISDQEVAAKITNPPRWVFVEHLKKILDRAHDTELNVTKMSKRALITNPAEQICIFGAMRCLC